MSPLSRLVVAGAAIEALVAMVALLAGGLWPMIAALAGSGPAFAAQIAATRLLAPAMAASAAQFNQRWVLGMAVRGSSFLVVAVIIVVLKDVLPPGWTAAGYLGVLLPLLFVETRFLK